ncbi:MAG TPA: diacylglycerol kinase family protein, partial [Gemmatales bacterium]|nr:diacylglycerol kinase family protein [Gemmatales bacterium]
MGDTTRAALIFLNPRAGSGGAESLRIILSSALDQYAWRQTWVVIEKETHARELVPRLKQAAVEKIERVFVCGGDGTASMVASAIISAGLKEQLPLAIFPAGTGNSLARELGIPSDWTQAAQLLCSLESCLGLDAMRMGEKYYFLRIGAGLDAEAIQETSREQKRFLGRWAYFKSFLSKLFRPHRVHFRCIIDGRRRR